MDTQLIRVNLEMAIEVINSTEYDEGDFNYLENLLKQALEEAKK